MTTLRGKIEHEKLIHNGKLPRYIYKYISFNSNLFKTLINGNLWLASPLSFNDPFDCQIEDQTIWTIDKIINFIARGEKVSAKDREIMHTLSDEDYDWFGQTFNKSFRKTLNKIGISCFSLDRNNSLMWSHYANGHTGLCLKFDMLADSYLFKDCYKVNYSKEYPKILVEENGKANITDAILTKSKIWEYENEWRVIKNESGLIPYNPTSIIEIIFGVKTNSDDKLAIKTLMDSLTNKSIKYFQAYISKEGYEINERED
jgi:Protein of unknown function (DUF2971)